MRITSEIAVGRPASEAFDLLTNFERNTEWQKGMRSCVLTSDPLMRIMVERSVRQDYAGLKALLAAGGSAHGT